MFLRGIKKNSATFLILLLISTSVVSQHKLEIEIAGFRSSNGVMMLQLFDEKQKVVDQKMEDIYDNKCVVLFGDLKPGKYGVRFFHDENLSGKMETNLFGKPVEGYGFSNNATGKFGPPPFEKWLFDLNNDKKITLKTIY